MATRTYFSKHVSKKNMDPESVASVLSDIALFNRIVHTAAAAIPKDGGSRKKKTDGEPDLRKKENAALKKTAPDSLHVKLKKKFLTDDHFTNSAVNTAKAALSAVEELNKLNIHEAEAALEDLRKALPSRKGVVTRFSNIKEMLVKASRDIKAGKKPSYTLDNFNESYNPDDGKFRVLRRGKPTGREYGNAYLFELNYVTPKLKAAISRVKLLEEKEARLVKKIEDLKAAPPGICFGSKKLFRQQNDKKKYPSHDTWLSSFRKRRCHSLMVSGRKDAAQGNFRFRYDTKSHTLTYYPQCGKPPVVFSGVVFPYGQENVDAAITADAKSRHACAWRVIETGGSFLIQCMVNVDASGRLNNFYGNGCVSMDSNVDNVSAVELDMAGNILRHKIVPFDLEGKSSGRAEHMISKALDEVFRWCDESKKPFVMEDLSLKHVANHYGSKKRNRVTSAFAFSKITLLAESKALKHSVEITKVNPAYTSQAGKLLFMKKYGISIHEAAAAAIGRRGLGIRERLPDVIKRQLPEKAALATRQKQWKAAYPITKKLKPKDMYSYKFA